MSYISRRKYPSPRPNSATPKAISSNQRLTFIPGLSQERELVVFRWRDVPLLFMRRNWLNRTRLSRASRRDGAQLLFEEGGHRPMVRPAPGLLHDLADQETNGLFFTLLVIRDGGRVLLKDLLNDTGELIATAYLEQTLRLHDVLGTSTGLEHLLEDF